MNLGKLLTLINGSVTPSTIRHIVLPNGLREIGKKCFAYTQIQEITVPASVEVIGKEAFYHTTLEKISFLKGSRLREIQESAF